MIADAFGTRRPFDPAATAQSFAIGMAVFPAQLLARPLAELLMTEAAGADLRLRSFRDRREAITLLDDGRVDAALGVSPSREARILQKPLFEQAFVGIARSLPKSHLPFASLDAFCASKHLLVSPDGNDFGAVTEHWRDWVAHVAWRYQYRPCILPRRLLRRPILSLLCRTVWP